jgi:hypothetical protein
VSGEPQIRCPDWRRLAAARDAGPGDPPGWDEALRHLDGCPACRESAVAADPLLAFHRLPGPALGADEVEAMRLRVAALRGAGRLTSPRGVALGRRGWADRSSLHLRQAAAAAVVMLALLAGGNLPHAPLAPGPVAAVAPVPPGIFRTAAPALPAVLASEPLLEGIDQPFDHVVQWNGDDLSVVLVVDERLGV